MNAPIQLDRSHIENSRPLPWDRDCSADQWPDALDYFMDRLEASESRVRKRKAADRATLKATLGSLLIALYSTAAADPEQWLGYPRNKNDYDKGDRYAHPKVTHTAVVTAVDFLVQAGFAEHRMGSYHKPYAEMPKAGWGYRSRIKATRVLIDVLEGQFGIELEAIHKAEWIETVRLKGTLDKRLAPYKDTTETHRMRAELLEINEHLSQFQIDVEQPTDSPSSKANDASFEIDPDDLEDCRDRSADRLYRVFNNHTFDHGGRFYGGWWQSIKKQYRERILIDGEETIELDFKALHPRLCYQLEGIPLPTDDDPYTLDDLERDGVRSLIKTTFLKMLNARPGMTLRPPEGWREVLPSGLSYKKLAAAIEVKHSAIGGWFRSGRGVELQRIDSDIAAAIMLDLLHQGVCCLPVHDSFIVPHSAEVMLGQAMYAAYRDRLGGCGLGQPPPVVSGWSSEEVEKTVGAAFT